MDMPGRSVTPSDAYKYGFNGKINEKELSDGAQDFDARMYDNRLGRFFSKDPLEHNYPAWSPYNYAINSPIACKDNGGKNPIITTQMVNGTLIITVHQRVYLVMDNMKNVGEAMSLVGNPTSYFTGNNSNSVNTTISSPAGAAIPVTFNFVYDVGVYEKEEDAVLDYTANGFGVITMWKHGSGSPNWTAGRQDKIVMYSQNNRAENNDRGEYAHELSHDWTGLNDGYVNVMMDGQSYKGMVVANPNVPYSAVQPLRDLMNDANSPLSPNNISRVAQAIYNMYGANGGGVVQPLNPTLLTTGENGTQVSITAEGHGFWFNSQTNTYKLSGLPLHQINGTITVINGVKYLSPRNWWYRSPINVNSSRWNNGNNSKKHKIVVPQAKF